ncbi:MAG: beta-N-acetylhexosaminidase [Gammaproteobacteria bacterium]|nr:beta-N-acetylhexosaminidase [Gammaproteobacteria bacterium]
MIGPLVVDITSIELSQEDREFLQHPLVGGVILFTRNYAAPEQLKNLVSSIKSIRKADPLLVSVDHEGGRVQRFRDYFTKLPPMASLGSLYQSEPAKALHFAFLTGWLLASELRQYGLDYSYAPVLDLDYQMSQVIGDRAFHADPNIVSLLAQALINGLHAVGMAATGKHFPGHGAVSADSHVALPIDVRNKDAITNVDLIPYISLIKENSLESIMPAHVVYSRIDSKPACFSSFWLQTILRTQLGFKGVIVSDDLTMEGAAIMGNYTDRAEAALTAGCDMLLVCNNRHQAEQIVDHLSPIYRFSPETQERCERLYAKPLQDDFTQHPHCSAARAAIAELTT